MRRKEREIIDQEKIDAVIRDCDCCRLGLADGISPYIVPLNFGYERREGKAVFYFHTAREGRKIDLIEKNGYAGFELDTHHKVNTHETACGHSFRFQSVIGAGKVSIVSDRQERLWALELIMRRHTGQKDWKFDEKAVGAVSIIRLDVEEMTGKEHE